MASEVIKLNLIPKGEMPVFHASQFDTGRLITCELYRGEDAYSVPEGYTVELHCRKVDNNIVTMASTLINDNVVTFTSTEQLTACNGNNLCEVAILDEGYRIGTLNFILEVEIDPLKGGITSTSEIHNLETQVEEITTEIIGENYYNKTEVDDLLDTKANAADVYTKGQVDNALALKANAADVYTKSQTDTLLDAKASITYVDSALALKANAADVYTKAQTDSLLSSKADISYVDAEVDDLETAISAKANASDVYTKTQVDTALALKANAEDVYTKAETDAKIEEAIEEIMPVDTAGPSAIANFTTALALPLVNCSVGITATGGNGTPDNPNPIRGYTSANITRCGVNLFDVDTWLTSLNVPYTKTGDTYSLTTSSMTYNNPFVISKTDIPITLSVKSITGTATNVRLQILNSSNTVVESCYANETKTATGCKVRINYSVSGTAKIEKPQIVLGSTPVEYTAYNGTTYHVSWQNEAGTVYGGVLDVTRGKLKPCIEYPSYNGETLSGRWLSSEATYIEGTTPPTGSQVVSLDDYGTDIDLTPEVISAVVGENNVYSDTNGDTTVKFKDTIQNYIDKKVST